MTIQPQLLKDDPENRSRGEDKALHKKYREMLRKYLQDSEFRKTEGFPIGEDDAIYSISDPPNYTACPNPFIREVLDKWRSERSKLQNELDIPSSVDNDHYQREPFASDVSESKAGRIYNTHIYHTKVPHKAIMRYILHYTDPGDIVYDGFCGTGMTGVAAKLCGDKKEIESLGLSINSTGEVFEGKEMISRIGSRKCIMVDLSPAATFIAHNQNAPVNVMTFKREAERILDEIKNEYSWMYETWHPSDNHSDRVKGLINYTIWSEVFACPNCGEEMVFWEIAVDESTGYRKKKEEPLKCNSCGMKAPITQLERLLITKYDEVIGSTIKQIKRVPIKIVYKIGKHTFEKRPDKFDLELIEKINAIQIKKWFPSNPIMFKGEKWGDTWRAGVHAGITHLHHLYTKRNLMIWSELHHKISNVQKDIQQRLLFWSQTVSLGQTILNRYLAASFSQVNRILKGTMYIAPIISEVSPWYSLTGKIKAVTKANIPSNYISVTSTQSASSLQQIPDKSIDYIFVDPPFGKNIIYSELNFIWEAWLGVITNNSEEAIISASQNKDLEEYLNLIEKCFEDFYRILKPGRWLTLEFHNSSNSVWNAIIEAMLRAGFVIADVSTLDKQQLTMQQMISRGAVKQDLIISAYKPESSFSDFFDSKGGSIEGAWEFIRQHLKNIRKVLVSDNIVQTIPERMDYLLFDRMIAYHIQRGVRIPLSASEFYGGLNQKFIERDGMYFLPEQVGEYDQARLSADSIAQLTFIITDERNSIIWLRQQLGLSSGGQPLTYQEIQPKFLQQLQQVRHEELPELLDILEQNFLQDDQGRWYVPDPYKASDLEKLRNKTLIRDFEHYLTGRGQLKHFRTEAVRAGFAAAWQRRDFKTIVRVANRLPERVLQEDPDLLMYYDNASLRVD